MPQVNRTSFVVQKLKGKNLKPGGFKQASQDLDTKQYGASYDKKQDLPTNVNPRSLMTPIAQQGKVSDSFFAYEDFEQSQGLEFSHKKMGNFLELQTNATLSEILNQSEDEEEDGPDDDEGDDEYGEEEDDEDLEEEEEDDDEYEEEEEDEDLDDEEE